MRFLHKYGTRPNEIRRAKRELYFRLGMVAAVLVFFAIMIMISSFRPRLPENQDQSFQQVINAGDPQSNPQLVPLRREVEELVEKFDASRKESGVETDDLGILDEAIEIQRKIIRLGGSEIASKTDLDRLYELEAMYDEEMGSFFMSESRQLEQEAELKWIAAEYEEGLKLMQRARDLQERVNSQFPKSTNRDPSRLHVLTNKILSWQTGPLAQKADQLKLDAMRHLDAGEHESALSDIREALELQKEINTSFRDSRYASISRTKSIEAAYEKIITSKDVSRMRSLVEEARADLQAREPEKALALLEEAAELQMRLEERYPDTALEFSYLKKEIAVLQDTCSSQKSYYTIEQLRDKTRQALADQDMPAFNSSISDWYREVRKFKISYPQSEYLDERDDAEVNFLYDLRESIPSIMDMIYGNLIPVPGNPHLHIYRTEVPQVLYRNVTGENPSAAVFPTNPVESLTWEEAKSFTRMAGWILSRPVSLPDRSIYLASLGSVDPAEQARKSWSSESSNRQIREVGTSQANENGISDILGNVSEWMKSESDSPAKVAAFGGAARDSRLRLAAIPEDTREPIERNRFIGFRFTVTIED